MYFIRSGAFLKVGRASDLHTRVQQYATHNPSFELVHAIRTSHADLLENGLHQQLYGAHHRNEWFKWEESQGIVWQWMGYTELDRDEILALVPSAVEGSAFLHGRPRTRSRIEMQSAADVNRTREQPPVSASSRTTRDELTRLIAERYSCLPGGTLPRGAISELARSVSVTRERVRQILRVERGMEYGPKPPRGCSVCDGIAEKKSPYCVDCGHPPVACVGCGTITRKRRSDVLEPAFGRKISLPGGRETERTGKFFCGRRCYGEWFTKHYGNGSANYRKPIAAVVPVARFAQPPPQ